MSRACDLEADRFVYQAMVHRLQDYLCFPTRIAFISQDCCCSALGSRNKWNSLHSGALKSHGHNHRFRQ